jgi:hypothetical protein
MGGYSGCDVKVTTCLDLELTINVCVGVYAAIPPLPHTPQINTWTVLLYCFVKVCTICTIKRITYIFAPNIRRIYKLPEERLCIANGM